MRTIIRYFPTYASFLSIPFAGFWYRVLDFHLANTTPKVSQIKEKVEEKEGIPPAQQRLIYGGKQMYA